MTEQQRGGDEEKQMNDWGRVESKCNKGRDGNGNRAVCGVTREWEEIIYTNKSYMNKNQLSLKWGMNRNKETIAG